MAVGKVSSLHQSALLETSELLELDHVIEYLLARDELLPSDLVHTDFWVEQLERKNISFILHTDRPTLLLKRPRNRNDVGIFTEAAAYRALRPTDVGGYMPDLRFFDSDRQTLALDYLQDSVTLRDYHRLAGSRSPAYIGRMVGQMLSTLHRSVVPWHAHEMPPPWALTILSPPISILETESSGTLDVLRQIQADSALARIIEALLNNWTAPVLCHNDVRLDNLLLVPDMPNRTTRRTVSTRRLAVIDWELCGPGNSLWDIAGLLGAYVELWVTDALRVSQLYQPTSRLAANRDIGCYQKLMLAFWRGYQRGSSADSSARPTSILQAAQLIAVRLMQGALEYSQRTNNVTQESLALLKIAQQFAVHPLESWVHVLGLPLTAQTGRFNA